MQDDTGDDARTRPVVIDADGARLNADITHPEGVAHGVVLFAHGSGSSRFSPRNKAVAGHLVRHGLVTVMLDLLTESEDERDRVTREYRFDIPRLAGRLASTTDWLDRQPDLATLAVGYFGASTGAAAALIAASQRADRVTAVVSRGGRPDLAGDALPAVHAPTLLIVGGRDEQVLELNRQAAERMHAPVEIEIVEGATHLFEEPGALDQVADLAARWFGRHLRAHA